MNGTYLRVGLMIIASLGLAVGLVLFLGQNRVHDGLEFESYFGESVQGLDVGSPVKFRGVQLGQVSTIQLASAAYREAGDVQDPLHRQVVVRYAVDPKKLGTRDPDIAAAVRAGLRARLAAQGITGLAYVELDFVDPIRFPAQAVDWKPVRMVIPSMPSTISQFQDAAQALAAKLQNVDLVGIADSIQGLVEDSRAQLKEGDLKAVLSDAAATMRALKTGVDAADLAAVSADLRAALVAVRDLAGGPQSRELIAATTKTAERLSEATARLPALIASLEATVRRANAGTADLQAELVPILRDVRATAANLRDTTDTLRRYPAGTLLGGPPPREAPSARGAGGR